MNEKMKQDLFLSIIPTQGFRAFADISWCCVGAQQCWPSTTTDLKKCKCFD